MVTAQPATPSNPQSPPTDFRCWDFSFSVTESRKKNRNTMRFIDPETEQAYFCEEIAEGSWAAISDSKDANSHLEVWCQLDRIENGIAYTSIPEGIEVPGMPSEGTRVPASKYRLCAVTPTNAERAQHPEGWWRFRDEVNNTLRYVSGYRGIVYWYWNDHGPHVHVDGLPAIIDPQTNLAWFYQPEG